MFGENHGWRPRRAFSSSSPDLASSASSDAAPSAAANFAPCSSLVASDFGARVPSGREVRAALADRPLEQPARQRRRHCALTANEPADSPKIVTLPGSPPKAAMFSCTHFSAATDRAARSCPRRSGRLLRQLRMGKEAEDAQPVVHRDDDDALARERGAVVARLRAGSAPGSRRRGSTPSPAASPPRWRGVQTFRYRQSSLMLVAEDHVVKDLVLHAARAELVALRTPSMAGGLRRLPAQLATGGAAKGMPRNVRTLPSTLVVPSTVPASVFTCANAEVRRDRETNHQAPRASTPCSALCRMCSVLFGRAEARPYVRVHHYVYFVVRHSSFVHFVIRLIRRSSFVIRARQALRSGLGGDGRNASRDMISTRIASDSSDSATRRDNCAGLAEGARVDHQVVPATPAMRPECLRPPARRRAHRRWRAHSPSADGRAPSRARLTGPRRRAMPPGGRSVRQRGPPATAATRD